MTYVYGYDIRCTKESYGKEWRTVGKGNRNVIVSHKQLTDEEVIEKRIMQITTSSCCRYSKSLEERVADTRKLFEFRNIKLLRSY